MLEVHDADVKMYGWRSGRLVEITVWLAVACIALLFAATVITASWIHSLQIQAPFRPQLKGLFLLFLPSVVVYLMMLGHLQDGVQFVTRFFRDRL